MNIKYREKRLSNTTASARVWGFILAFLVCFSFLLAVEPALVQAQDYGLNATADAAKLPKDATPIQSRVGSIVGIALSFVGVIFLILMIYAGVMWMTAAGNETQVSKAKDIIIASVIGLVIVLSAYAITYFIGNALTS